MDLFHQESIQNLLPFDGEVNYYGPIINAKEHALYFALLLETIAWKQDEAIIFGKKIITQRKVAWYGDSVYDYTYSNTTKTSLIWTPILLELKQKVEQLLNTTFNSCLLNLYHSGDEGVGWHSDDEKMLERGGEIASLSFGAERQFSLKHKTEKAKTSLILQSGSLLVMKGKTQIYWLHSLPKTKKVKGARINLTFRKMDIQNL